jgi:hypothetical protein
MVATPEHITQGLWRLPSVNPPSLHSSRVPFRVVHTASLASTLGARSTILDTSPADFWNLVKDRMHSKDIYVVINGDLIRDRILNTSLPWYPSPFTREIFPCSQSSCWDVADLFFSAYFTTLLQACPKTYRPNSVLQIRTSGSTTSPQSLYSYLQTINGLDSAAPVPVAGETYLPRARIVC